MNGIQQDENSMNVNMSMKNAAPFETVEPTLPLPLPLRDSFQKNNEMEMKTD
jgi:hypothetical protein